MAKVNLLELKADPAIHIRQKTDEETIERYMDTFEELPPIVVFDTPEGLLLADGFHRWAAAMRLGLSGIEAVIKGGDRNDALEYAVTANIAHGKPLTRDEYKDAVRRIKQLHSSWSNSQIAQEIKRSDHFVATVLKSDEIRKHILRDTSLEDRKLTEIHSLDKSVWEPLVRKAEEKKWTVNEISAIVQEVKSEQTPFERKKALMEGTVEPVVSKDGEPAILRETVERRIAEGIAGDKVVALTGAWSSLSKLEQFNPREVVDSLDNFHLERVVKDTPRDIDYLTQLVKFARQRLELWEEVDR